MTHAHNAIFMPRCFFNRADGLVDPSRFWKREEVGRLGLLKSPTEHLTATVVLPRTAQTPVERPEIYVAMEEIGSSGVFDPEMVAVINRAYESACDVLDLRNGQPDLRVDLARCLLDLAKRGVAEEFKLRDEAISALKRRMQVRERAYQLWEEAGRPSDRDEEYWKKAEQELVSCGGERATQRADKTGVRRG